MYLIFLLILSFPFIFLTLTLFCLNHQIHILLICTTQLITVHYPRCCTYVQICCTCVQICNYFTSLYCTLLYCCIKTTDLQSIILYFTEILVHTQSTDNWRSPSLSSSPPFPIHLPLRAPSAYRWSMVLFTK